MYLKSLTLKGFKSFASSTTLHFEKGITAVVGPNGSGKSNVVDGIAWVLGEQGAKALRGGKMEDVIFAGTADRPPLGRAEVTLTIDNSDGALPIEYTEVSITRRMFRDGAGEYEINGSACRLLDIQELLSDSGIGREMHVIVGQGQLDAVLQARPEDRRAFIEEAAGVLKHRRRKERAARKLDAMQVNLTRLTDLTGELRRQLKPLGRQAEVARRAAGVQADLRDAKARLLADDLATLTAQIAREVADEQAAQHHRTEVEADLAAAVATEEAAQASVAAAIPAQSAAQDTWFALSALSERFRGLLNLAQERVRNLSAPTEQYRAGRDPQELEANAERAEQEQAERQAGVDRARTVVTAATERRTGVENALRAAETALSQAIRAVADRREGLARLGGQVQSARTRLTSGEGEIERLAQAADEARARAGQAEESFGALQGSIPGLNSSEAGLDDAHEQALAAVVSADSRLAELVADVRARSTEQAGLRARIDALQLALTRRDGAAALLAADLPGVSGAAAKGVRIERGYETAIAAALGPIAEAVAVSDLSAAVAALRWLREREAGRATLVVATADAPERPFLTLPDGARWASSLVRPTKALAGPVLQALDGVVVVDDVAAATVVLRAHPDLRAVTRDGDQLGPAWAAGGAAASESHLAMQAALDEAEKDLAAVQETLTELAAARAGAEAEAAVRRARGAETLSALHESDAALSAVSEQLGRWGESARAALAEAERLDRQRATGEQNRDRHRQELADLEARWEAAQHDQAPPDIDPAARDTLAEQAAVARQAEVEARLSLRTAEERARATAGLAENMRRQARTEREARERAAAASARRARHAAQAAEVESATRMVTGVLVGAVERAAADRAGTAEVRAAAETGLTQARAAAATLRRRWAELTDAVHRDEVLRAQQTVREEQLSGRAGEEFGLTREDLLAEFGPGVPVPPTAAELAEFELARSRGELVVVPQPVAYDRGSQERRAKRAERDLSLLGKVNPLALEEFAALEERHAFLSTQLEDLRATRRDLLQVIEEVDAKILEVFTAAYHDVAREFGDVFAALFPGGEGELVLTDPENMLTTGIEVNARPPGKKVKRLSLLSGGERSLTAVALLVAIFRARPSPFYIMDEVEAALDDVNLGRLIGLLTLLRDSSQLIIITHQKFTMEAADALYGVSMRGDGISQVISQRIRGMAPTPAG